MHTYSEVFKQETPKNFFFILIICELGCDELRQLFRSFSIENLYHKYINNESNLGADLLILFFLYPFFHFGYADKF